MPVSEKHQCTNLKPTVCAFANIVYTCKYVAQQALTFQMTAGNTQLEDVWQRERIVDAGKFGALVLKPATLSNEL